MGALHADTSSSPDAAQGEKSLSGIAVRSALSVVDLDAPITSDVVLEVRSGKLKPLEGLKILSGIDKGLCTGPVPVASLGIVGDEHDYVFHGGVDKAIHGYCATHYDAWKREFPAAADRFRPGGFGENLVFARFNERNLCIGDTFVVGADADADGDHGLLLEISLPRQPCFKLNHRFGLKDFAPVTHQTSRTGWYYRVLRPGSVQAGDTVRLVRRPHPDWPLSRVQEYLHRRKEDMARVAELAAIEQFGDECKKAFRTRLEKYATRVRKAERAAAASAAAAAASTASAAIATNDRPWWRSFRVVSKRNETPRITAFVLEAVEPTPADDLEPLGHVRLRLPVDGRSGRDEEAVGDHPPLVRAYSVVGGDRNRFEIGVSYDADTDTNAASPTVPRGGARYLHEAVAVGSVVQAGRFAPGIPFDIGGASHHAYVAGGVGITACLAQVEVLHTIHYSCVLHYAVRSAAEVAFAARLQPLRNDGTVVVYDASKGERLDLDAVVRSLPWNARLSVCGPPRMMDAARRAVRAAAAAAAENKNNNSSSSSSNLTEADVHFEAFSGDITDGGDPFTVVVANRSSDDTPSEPVQLAVGADETLLEVLQRQFGVAAVPSSCEAGNCATCKVTVRSGRIVHRGAALTAAEQAAGDAMLACVSRGQGRIVIEV
ncbi:Molybdenum cofactor sulfurase protein [Niveomyces insectorum RCEF 264]|uniref:Molybdenum cofactor sulfurase protein n=1 Tax=Niveomyces insectorum RCEF 264 TaxID=1081102 RepID=A0A167Q7C3_9HYPO|nr:Molybdenum cofactor sulfurase protein [Niveomyces insectorum RCEF 264]